MRPKLSLLDGPFIERILDEAFSLLVEPGVRVAAPDAAALLASAGASVEDGVARIPRHVAERALASAPREFFLHDREGRACVRYGGDTVHFDPGSSCVQILDSETGASRTSRTEDLVRLIRVAEMLPEYAAQSTALVCDDVPKEMGDLYRLFLVLWHSDKPVVTGAFTSRALASMIELLEADSGGREALRSRHRAVFDVCPSPPLHWTEFAAQSLVELSRAGVPAEIVPVPLAGAAAPVTLAGAVVQHAAECLSGIAIHQLAQPGSPIVWGGAPAIFDMRTGTTPMGAIETAMMDLACAEVGKHLRLPTHAYLGGSDAKLVDAQAGMESAVGFLLGALGGINMISGAGMLDFLAAQSVEKLVIDAEAIASARRFVEGIQARTPSLAVDMFGRAGLAGEFLKLPETRSLFRLEQHLPSAVIDRSSLHAWEEAGSRDAFSRARSRAGELLESYRRPVLGEERERRLRAVVEPVAEAAGMHELPGT
jgi:trimethylamine--corrinoid protein Co-methyltransferase